MEDRGVCLKRIFYLLGIQIKRKRTKGLLTFVDDAPQLAKKASRARSPSLSDFS